MNPGDLALIRSWIQGVSWDVMGEMYLDDADRKAVMRAVRQLREKLARKARQLGMDVDAQLWEQEREYSQDWMGRALKSVEMLKARPDPVPHSNDHYSRWLPQPAAEKLAKIKAIQTLAELATFISQNGADWWKQIPHLGKHTAELIHDFFSISASDLGITLDLSSKIRMPQDRAMVSHHIAPLERFAPPVHLTGETGTNRAPLERCRIDARNDYAAIMAWLSLWNDETATHRAYRKEAERFLLWAILEKGKALSSMTTPDCAEYRRFLVDPQPADRWIGKPAPRWTPEWRPLKGPLKPSSIRQAEVILSGFFEWLVSQRYLDSNPFTGLSTQGLGRRTGSTDRMLSPPLWENVRLFAFNQSKNLELSDLQRNDYWRTWFILNFAYQTGLRLQEIVNAKIGDLKVVSTFEGDQWWLDVIGKGNKYREVPISPDLLEAINQHLRNRNLGRIGYVLGDTPLIGKLRGSGRSPLSSSGLYQKLKKFFEEVARHIERTDPLSAEQLKRASTHWLRHTHGSHAVAKGVPLEIVRDNLGHSNISTTSIYLHTDRDDRYKAMLSMGGALATKSDSSP